MNEARGREAEWFVATLIACFFYVTAPPSTPIREGRPAMGDISPRPPGVQ